MLPVEASAVTSDVKNCPKCKTMLPLSSFYKDRSQPDTHRPYCRPCENARVLAYRARMLAEQPEVYAAQRRTATRTHLLRTYGITQERYDEMLEAQGGVCAICSRPERKRRRVDGELSPLAVDHDHSCCSGTRSCGLCVRGLLCNDCNTALGRFNDNLDRLTSAVAYLMRGESDQDERRN